MEKSSKVISFRKKKFEKKCKVLIKNKNYIILFLGIPLIISSLLTIDNYFVKLKMDRQGIKYEANSNTNLDYIMDETNENQYNDIKRYYVYKDKAEKFFDEKK